MKYGKRLDHPVEYCCQTKNTGDQVMAIVTIGNLIMQVPAEGKAEFIKELNKQIEGSVLKVIGRMLEESLETELDRFLGREKHVRRKRSKHQTTGVYCSKCRRHQRREFYRNGHYQRALMTHWGIVRVNMPQMRCRCGGHVSFKYQTIRPRQRIWDDVKVEVQVEHGRGLSYRQIKADLDERLGSSVGLRSLNQPVLALGQEEGSFAHWKKGESPPVVRVDGIWVSVMFPTEKTQTDKIGRKRVVKSVKKVPILAAQGVWPTTGRTQLIGWMRSDGEDADSWQLFLETLYEAGVTPQNGLALLVSDGSTGFRAAYENVYWQTPLQRCVFHKLRNMARAIRPPATLDRPAALQYSTDLLRSAAKIWQADDENVARFLFTSFCITWRSQQPRVVATLERDFDDTLTFFHVQEQAALRREIWPAHLLRTTSHHERMFREFRQLFRRAFSFHSPIGLQAATSQLAKRFS
jgi:putative transposase